MAWPTPQDYNEAIQTPRLSFDLPELASGEPELNALGLPRPITGGFASVYRMRCGSRQWAVRCFLREIPDQQERYAAISQALAAARLPYTVGFDYLPRGIRVQGRWYPVLKMEWVDGEPLDVYVARNLQDPAALRNLASRWREMTAALEHSSLAHGDLQHGNVLIVGGSLKLIDYDGLFVPALAGRPSHETGHRNYQHPARTACHFGPGLDRFSAWVIYLSLLALSADPTLAPQSGSDESLLLTAADFLPAGPSRLVQALLDHSDAEIAGLAQRFTELLRLPPDQTPPLPGAAEDRLALWKPARRRLSPGKTSAPGKQAPALASGTKPSPLPEWVSDALPSPVEDFGWPAMGTRAALAAALLTPLGVVLLVAHPGNLALSPVVLFASVLISTVLAVIGGFALDPGVRRLRQLSWERNQLRLGLLRARLGSRWLEHRTHALERRVLTGQKRLSAARARFQEEEKTGSEALQRRQAFLAPLDRKLERLKQAEARALEKPRIVRGRRMANLRRRMGLVDSVRTKGPARRVLQQKRLAARITSWKQRLQTQLEAEATLLREEEKRVRERFAGPRKRFEAEKAARTERTRLAEERWKGSLQARRERLAARADRLALQARRLQQTQEKMAAIRRRAAAAQLRLDEIRHEQIPYRRITFRRYVRRTLGV